MWGCRNIVAPDMSGSTGTTLLGTVVVVFPLNSKLFVPDGENTLILPLFGSILSSQYYICSITIF